jgi:copper chaperone NosL
MQYPIINQDLVTTRCTTIFKEVLSMRTKILFVARMAANLFIIFIIVTGISLVSCGKKTEVKPVNLMKDDKCSYCQMTIRNSAFASEIIGADGNVYTFDDYKCLESFMQKSDAPRIEAIFVKDYETRTWIPYDHATIVRTGLATPCRSGKVAFKDSTHAKEFAVKNPPL